MIASRRVAARRLAGLAIALCLLAIQWPASIAVLADPDEIRATIAGPPPRPDAPAAAIAFRQRQWKDERGSYPANAFVQAKSHADAMRARARATSSGVGLAGATTTGLPSGGGGPLPSAAGTTRRAWTWLGPGNIGGRVRALVIDPADPSIMFAGGVAGGLFKSTDRGASWTPVDDFMANLAVSTIVMQPNLRTTLYAGTGEGFYNHDGIRGAGVFTSIDGGVSWTQLASTATPSWWFVNRLAISPNGAVMLAATRTGVYRSIDGGVSWTRTSNTEATDVVFHPADSTKAIVSGYAGNASLSTDGGATWTASAGLPGGTFVRAEIAYARSNPAIVYASVDVNGGSIYKSTNGGASFAAVFNGAPDYLGTQGWYGNALWVDPTRENTLVVGGLDLWKSTNGGVSFSRISSWLSAPASVHADQHAIVEDPGFNGTTNTTVWVTNDGGVYRADGIYTAGGGGAPYAAGWHAMNHNLGVTQFYGASGGTATGVILGGTQDNGTLQYTPASGTAWTTEFGGDGGASAVDPVNNDNLYGEYSFGSIHRSVDGGANADWINGLVWNGTAYDCKPAPFSIPDTCGALEANFVAPLTLDPDDSSRLYVGGASLWRTSDATTPNTATSGPSWAKVKSAAGVGNYISAIAVAPGHPDEIWVGHNNGQLFKSINGTSGAPTWAPVGGVALPSRFLTRVRIDPTSTNTVYVAYGSFSPANLWKTTDGGVSWSSASGSGVTGLPPAPVRDIAINAAQPASLYAATEVGIFTSQDGGSTWTVANDGPANVSVEELFWMGPSLVAVTHGRGLFTTTPNASPQAPTITWPTPAAITYGTPLSATQLNATSNVAGTFVYTPAAGTVLPAGIGQALSVVFTPADSGTYTVVSAGVAIDVGKATPVVMWSPANMVFGTALGAAQLNASTSVPGTFAYTPPAGTVLPVGAAQTLSVTFTPADPANYATVTTSRTVTVAKATPVIAWPDPADIASGTALGPAQLNATANVPGAFVYSPAAGTILPIGLGQTLSAAFVPADFANYAGASATARINVFGSTPAIDAAVWTDRSSAVSAIASPAFATSATNELVLAFVATDFNTGTNTSVTSVTGAGLTWALVGRTNVQRGTSEIWRAFAPARLTNAIVTASLSQPVSSMLTIVSFANVDTSGVNGAGAIGATASANRSSGAPTATLVTTRNNSWVFGVGNDYDNPIARTLGAGQTMVHQYLAPVGDTYWVQRTTAVTPAAGTSVTITATAPVNDRYNLFIAEIRRPGVPDTAAPTVSLTAPAAGATVSGSNVTVSATAGDDVGVAGVQFKLDGVNLGAEDTASPYSVTWNTTTAANGAHALTAVARDGSGKTTAAIDINVMVANAVADTTAPSVSMTAPAAGPPLSGTVAVSASAADNVGVAGVQFLLDGAPLGAELTASPYTLAWSTLSATNGAHTLAARARDAANNTTTSVAVSVTVANLATPTIGWAPPASIVYGTPLGGGQLNATANVPGTFVYTPPAGTVLDAGARTLSVSFTPADSVSYTNATASVSITVARATPSIAWTAPAAIVYGTPLGAAQLNAAASTPGAFSYTPPAGTVLGAGAARTLSATFSPADSANYASATVSTTIAVLKASPSIMWPTPANITPGTPLGAAQLNATADVPGGFAYTPPAGTVLNAGSDQVLQVVFTPADLANYVPVSASVRINVAAAVPTIDSTVWTDQPSAVSSLVSPPFSTSGTSELLLAFVSTDFGSGTNTSVTSVTGAGLAWVLVGRTNVQAGTSEIWRAFAPMPLTNATVTANLSQPVSAMLTVVSFVNVDTSGTNGSGAIGATASANRSSGAPTATLVTTRNNSWVFGVGNDYDNPIARTLGAGQTMVHQYLAPVGDTYWVQRTTAVTPAAGTSVTINATAPTGDRSNLFIAEIRGPGGADTTAPTVALTAPAAGAIVSGTAATLAASASDNVGVAGIQFLLDGEPLGAEVTAAPYVMTWETTTASNGTHSLSARARDAAGNLTTSAPVTVTVANLSTPTITWPAPPAIVFGTPLTTAQLNASASVPGTFVYEPAGGTVLNAGSAQTLSVTFTPADPLNFTSATASVKITVAKAVPVVTWPSPAAIAYGTPLSATQLNASANVAGSFVYSPAADSILDAGTGQALSVTFTPADTENYATATASVSIDVDKTTPTIGWNAPADITYGTDLSATELNATATVPGTFVYAPPAGTILGAGAGQTLSVSFTPTDATNYATATASVSINVGRMTPTITWTAPAEITYGTALSATELNATATVPGTFVYAPPAGTILGAGAGQTLSVSFTPTDTTNYATATASVPINVAKTTPVLTWTAPADITFGTALGTSQLNASANVAGTFVYSPAADSLLDAGNGQILSVTFTPADAANYTIATASVSINVGRMTPTITWTAPADITYGTALTATHLNASAHEAGTFVYSPAAGAILNAGIGQILSVTFTPADAANYTPLTASVSINVAKATPMISWPAPANIIYETPLSAGQLNATANVPGTFVYTPAAGTVLGAGSPQTLSVSFMPADLPNYTPAAASAVITVLKATPTVTWAPPATMIAGTALGAAQLNATANVPGIFVYTPAAGTVLPLGPSQPLALTFIPADAANYASVTAAATITVLDAKPAIDVQVWTDQAPAASPIVSPAFSTSQPNELLLAFVSTDYNFGTNTVVTNVTGGGLTWVLVARTNVQSGTSEIWRAFATTRLTGVTVSASMSQPVSAMITVVSFANVDTSGTNGSGAVGAVASANASFGGPTASLVTTRNNSWVFGVGNDFDRPIARTVGAGQTMVHQYLAPVGDTYWVQRTTALTPLAGTTVRLNDTAPTSDRYNFTICEVRGPQ